MTICEKLNTLTAGEIRGNLEKFIFIYGEKAAKILELEKITDFSFWDNGRSVIIYAGSQAVFIVILVFYIYVYNNRCIVAICSLTAVVLKTYILFLQW